jgi:hypothetical protein
VGAAIGIRVALTVAGGRSSGDVILLCASVSACRHTSGEGAFGVGVRHLRRGTGATVRGLEWDSGPGKGAERALWRSNPRCVVSYELRKSPIKFAGGSRIEVERTCSTRPMSRGAAVAFRALSASSATGSAAQSAEPIAALTSLSSRCNTELGVGTRPAGSVNRQVMQIRVKHSPASHAARALSAGHQWRGCGPGRRSTVIGSFAKPICRRLPEL